MPAKSQLHGFMHAKGNVMVQKMHILSVNFMQASQGVERGQGDACWGVGSRS